MTNTTYLTELFRDRFGGARLGHAGVERLRAGVAARLGVIDAAGEGYLDPTVQRDLSVRFHWGHDHFVSDEWTISGRMGNRHIDILAHFMDHHGLRQDLTGLRVLDIGAWTGGMSLLLAALGAQVTALEEVRKYAGTVNFLADLYQLSDRLVCVPDSLYDFLPRHADVFDLIIYSGVVYHVTDPLLSLRLAFGALKDGGEIFVETAGLDHPDSVCIYEGPMIHHNGSVEELNRGGWNYFIPSPKCLFRWCSDAGFQSVNTGPVLNGRIHASAGRSQFRDFLRAGISVRSVR
jgi:2-polyprenyl-3-methyl-5-hydroxy-6-metoxy-1,4-benzoquinol methylase